MPRAQSRHFHKQQLAIAPEKEAAAIFAGVAAADLDIELHLPGLLSFQHELASAQKFPSLAFYLAHGHTGERVQPAYLRIPWSRGCEKNEALWPGKLCPGGEEAKMTSNFTLDKACHPQSKGNAA